MTTCPSPRVLFRIAAGPRIGFGHLVRCRSLARVLGCDPIASVRGTAQTRALAGSMGWRVVEGAVAFAIDRVEPDVIVIDDPSSGDAATAVRRARHAGIPVAAIYQVGLGYVESDLGIDGSIEPRHSMKDGELRGPAFIVLDPAIVALRSSRHVFGDEVVIALGGGNHAREVGVALARKIAAISPRARIAVAAGFTGRAAAPLPVSRWLSPDALLPALSRAAVAVTAGGASLYEACALGVPVVAIALTTAKRSEIAAMARLEVAIDAGSIADSPSSIDRAANGVVRLLADIETWRRMAASGPRVVDGRGAFRVAEAVRRLAAPIGAGAIHAA